MAAPLPTVRKSATRRTTDPDVAVRSRRYVPATVVPMEVRVSVAGCVRERTPANTSAGFPGRNSAVTPAGSPARVTVATASPSAAPIWESVRSHDDAAARRKDRRCGIRSESEIGRGGCGSGQRGRESERVDGAEAGRGVVPGTGRVPREPGDRIAAGRDVVEGGRAGRERRGCRRAGRAVLRATGRIEERVQVSEASSGLLREERRDAREAPATEADVPPTEKSPLEPVVWPCTMRYDV